MSCLKKVVCTVCGSTDIQFFVKEHGVEFGGYDIDHNQRVVLVGEDSTTPIKVGDILSDLSKYELIYAMCLGRCEDETGNLDAYFEDGTILKDATEDEVYDKWVSLEKIL